MRSTDEAVILLLTIRSRVDSLQKNTRTFELV